MRNSETHWLRHILYWDKTSGAARGGFRARFRGTLFGGWHRLCAERRMEDKHPVASFVVFWTKAFWDHFLTLTDFI